MRKSGFTGFCCSFFVLCLVAMAFGAPDEVKGSPSLVFPESVYEFDTVFEGVSVVHDFIVQNRGTSTLDIKRASGG